MKQDKKDTYDYAFIGLGASNSLILLALIQKGLLKNKSVAIFEAEKKSENDKTYCFWAGKNDTIVHDLSPIISRRFNGIRVNESNVQNIEDQPYHYIRSLDLYQYTLNKINQENITVYRAEVNQIIDENEIYSVCAKDYSCQAHFIFDSRPPSIEKLGKNEIYLKQSFFGFHVRCEQDVFKGDTFEMMNFNVDQSDYTQFMYVIPFSPKEALIEFTRFGSAALELSYASDVLNQFILKNFGSYEILANESGCIPMTTWMNPISASKGILKTGASANLIKPSTGYAFKNMHSFAVRVAEDVASDKLENFNRIGLESKKRFKFYDHLLLMILMLWPAQGKSIFVRLFQKIPVNTIFSFLDEKTTMRQEMKIFSSLPIFPFLKALILYFKNENWLRYVFAFILVVSYSILSIFYLQFANYFSYAVLFFGLLSVGIPHGALDHMLSRDKKISMPRFVFKYLLMIGAYFLFWQIAPALALFVFVVYSSFHFGESEWIETGRKMDSIGAKLSSFLIGLSILIFIVFSHLGESFGVISQFITIPDFDFKPPATILTIMSLGYLILQSVRAKKWSFFRLLFLLILGTQVPLIMAFGLYFIFQHSLNAWGHLKEGLAMNTMQLHKKSLFFTLGALIVFLLIAFNATYIQSMEGLWATFFVFIACISFPHFLMMHLFYTSKL